MRLGVDMDEVICQTINYISYISPEGWDPREYYSHRNYFDPVKAMGIPKFFLSILPYPGAIDALNSFMDAGDEVNIITAREGKYTNATIGWVNTHFGNGDFEQLYIIMAGSSRSKAEYADMINVDYFIEDNPQDIELLIQRNIRVIQKVNPYAPSGPLIRDPAVVLRTDNWEEISEFLKKKQDERLRRR